MLSDAELDACAELLEELATYAAGRIVAERPRADQISTKTTLADWVTETDLAVERHVRAAVLERFPGHRVVGEEYGESGAERAAATWYVDPVDGTTNFVHALPWSSFSLAVVDDAGPAAGVVVDPYRGEVLSAVRGRGARRDGAPAVCSDAASLTGGIVLTEMSAQSLWPGMTALMAALADADCVTRIMGSNALSLASVGAARAVATAIGSFGPIDCCAGMLIARESGARVFAGTTEVSDNLSRALAGNEPLLCVAPGVAEELHGLWANGARDGD
ncbi:MAG TPA: inositol monophosphatase family protein [Gaiellaceae bacterium]|nr:inositol monophosphatase family protein [Gaiellaceae bacterium]